MSKLSDDIKCGLGDLIEHISGLEDGSEEFNQKKRHYIGVVKRSNNMYFSSNKEINENIEDMANKFILHGFFTQADELKIAYGKYITENLSESECQNRLNNVKFILEMSESPTRYFFENPEEFLPKHEEKIDNINWKQYLNEGIERWEPNFDDESSISADSSISSSLMDDIETQTVPENYHFPTILENRQDGVVTDFRTSREELLANVQHTWFKTNRVFHKPPSDWREANIGILWEQHLDKQVNGLIALPRSNVISEYKVIREVLFQMWTLHSSVVFQLEGNAIKIRPNVTMSSVRRVAFENFMHEFIPYMELMEKYRDFLKCNEADSNCPCTYRSYAYSIKKLIAPTYRRLVELEASIRKQESTYTLIKLAGDLMEIFEPVRTLDRIHTSAVLDHEKTDFLTCSTSLISYLHFGLQMSLNKLHQDLSLTVFVETLYHYMQLINSWLVHDTFHYEYDYTREFVIENKNGHADSRRLAIRTVDWTMNYKVREGIPEECAKNGLIKIITDEVLKIGRNMQLLRLLGQYDVIEVTKETIHEEFIRRTLEEICKFFEVDPETINDEAGEIVETNADVSYKFPVIPCEGDSKNVSEMARLANLVDTSDGFLMKAFEDFFIEKPKVQRREKKTLYEKISQITTVHLLPINNFFENIFYNILKDRFTVSGLMVKNVLIENYKLHREICFLSQVFLFKEDLIFPFYRRLFKKMNFSKNWGNEIWLTSNLQDVLVDVYPEFYEKCSVLTKENWSQTYNSLDCCKMVSIQYEVEWPNNIIVTPDQMEKYSRIFEFLLKLKWALYTLNHLVFSDLEPKSSKKETECKKLKLAKSKLKYLKFCMINLVNSVQHFVFGFNISKSQLNFELEFEKSNDLNSIRSSHENFLNSVHDVVMIVSNTEQNKYGFNALLIGIRALDTMWNNIQYASLEKLKECNRIYEKSFQVLNPLINPVYILNY